MRNKKIPHQQLLPLHQWPISSALGRRNLSLSISASEAIAYVNDDTKIDIADVAALIELVGKL